MFAGGRGDTYPLPWTPRIRFEDLPLVAKTDCPIRSTLSSFAMEHIHKHISDLRTLYKMPEGIWICPQSPTMCDGCWDARYARRFVNVYECSEVRWFEMPCGEHFYFTEHYKREVLDPRNRKLNARKWRLRAWNGEGKQPQPKSPPLHRKKSTPA